MLVYKRKIPHFSIKLFEVTLLFTDPFLAYFVCTVDCYGFCVLLSSKMSLPSSSSDMPSQTIGASELILQRRVPDKEFVLCFGNDNNHSIKELPIDVRGILLIDLELSSSQDEHGSEWVEEMADMSWMDEEV